MLNDGVEVQVEISEDESIELSAQSRVQKSLDELKTSFALIAGSISGYADDIDISKNIKETKISIGLKVGLEGNLILSKSTIDAHIKVEFTLR